MKTFHAPRLGYGHGEGLCRANSRTEKSGLRFPPPRSSGLGLLQTPHVVEQTHLAIESSLHSSPLPPAAESIHPAAVLFTSATEPIRVEDIPSPTASSVDLHNPFSVLEKATLVDFFPLPDQLVNNPHI